MAPFHSSKQPVPAAKNAPFYTPEQTFIAGKPKEAVVRNADGSERPLPKLFQPFTVKGHTFHHRITLSPMIQSSADYGHLTPFHFVQYGGIIQKGPGFAIAEATAVAPNGRGVIGDAGLWQDSQIGPFKNVVDFAHSQNQTIFLQLYHAGRKAGFRAPWTGDRALATDEQGGFSDDIIGPSPIQYNEHSGHPRELTTAEVRDTVQKFKQAAARALEAGFDGVEIHSAHGYLIHEFLSGVSNRRTDEYGGSFENRTRFLIEIVDAINSILPADKVLLVRISATDGLEEHEQLAADSWTVDQSIKLAHLLAEHKVDILDVSSYGNHPDQKMASGPAYQMPFAKAIKDSVGDKLLVGTVGKIDNARLANKVLEEDGLDYVAVGRPFLLNPGLVHKWGEDLGVEVHVPIQFSNVFRGIGTLTASQSYNK